MKIKACLYPLILNIFATPSHGINLISGTTPIKKHNDYYLWLSNNSSCRVELKVIKEGQQYHNDSYDVHLEKKSLEINERAMLKINKKSESDSKNELLRIMQTSDCGIPRINVIKLTFDSTI